MAWKGHRHHNRSDRGTSRRPNWLKRINIFGLIKAPFAIFAVVVLIASIYLTFTTWFIGLFIPPIVCIAIAGGIIRFFDRDANGMKFFYDTLALGGVFLILAILLLYQLFAPIFGMFGGIHIGTPSVAKEKSSTVPLPNPEINEKQSAVIPEKKCYLGEVVSYRNEIFHNGESILSGFELSEKFSVKTESYSYPSGPNEKDKFVIVIENNLPSPVSVKLTYDRRSNWYSYYEKGVQLNKTVKANTIERIPDPYFVSNDGLRNLHLGDANLENLDYEFIEPNVITTQRTKITETKEICE